MKRIPILALAFVLLFTGAAAAQVYKDKTAPVDARVRDLLSRMTLDEKFWQLFMLADNLDGGVKKYTNGAFGFQFGMVDDSVDIVKRINAIQKHFVEETRLGIPIIPFAEALHGLVQKGTTVFPQAIGLAATFDTTLMHDLSRAIAEECRGRGIRQVLSPVVNIASDVRWGRTEETYGEDPFLSSAMGVAFVSEFEKLGVIATPKHFVANFGNGGRDSYPIEFDERLLREIYLPPFQACIQRGRARSIMTSYNSLDGSPCSANDWLNNKLLKEEWKFDGFVISDAGAVGGANVLHFTAKDYSEATERAIGSGLDVIFQTSFDHYLLFIKAFQDGKINPEVIDRAVGRVLKAKIELGLFENPYVEADPDLLTSRLAEHRRLAKQAALESIVLLKNDNSVLPLPRSARTLAVIGADASEARFGGYSGPGNNKVSIVDGLKRRLGTAGRILYAKGCDRTTEEVVTVPSEVLSSNQNGELKPGLVGEYFDNIKLEGSPVLTRIDPQIQFQWTLFSPDPAKLTYDFYSVRWHGTLAAPVSGKYRLGVEGNDGYRLYLDGRLIIDNWQKVTCRTQLAEVGLQKGKKYDLRIEYYEATGNARFRLVWNVGVASSWKSEIDQATRVARQADVAIVVAGIEEGEFRDRAFLSLPGHQEELIKQVAATAKQTIVILVGGSAITMGDWLDRVPAVLDVWYPGEVGGEAVADILFGDVSPSGRLPVTFPVAEGQLPLVNNHKPTGRGDDYGDLTGQPLFPFGYGLSYTQFEYSGYSVDRQQISPTDSAIVHFTVKNTGAHEADEVVQLYLRDEIASVSRPVTELKGFQRIHLKPGELRDLVFVIRPELLTMLDRNLKPVIEPGDFRIMIGASSKDIRLRGILTVKE